MHHKSLAYKNAFAQYLRRGTPIAISLKMSSDGDENRDNHSTTHYIWHTVGDNRVRSRHAQRDGEIFSWNNPPEGGHPKEDWGCRCWAEPYQPRITENARQTVISIVDEGLKRWSWYDFVAHFYFGDGDEVKLENVGHLQNVITHTERLSFSKFSDQLADKSRIINEGDVSYSFNNGYDFSEVGYIHRISKINGSFQGNVKLINNYLHVLGKVNYKFSDRFTDPLSIRQTIAHTPINIISFIQKISKMTDFSVENLTRLYNNSPKYQSEDIIEWLRSLSEVGGKAYDITGQWDTQFEGVFDKDRSKSNYAWN